MQRGRPSLQPIDFLSLRPGQSLLDVFRAVPRTPRRVGRVAAKPTAALRPDRPNDPKGPGTTGHQGGREDVGARMSRTHARPVPGVDGGQSVLLTKDGCPAVVTVHTLGAKY